MPRDNCRADQLRWALLGRVRANRGAARLGSGKGATPNTSIDREISELHFYQEDAAPPKKKNCCLMMLAPCGCLPCCAFAKVPHSVSLESFNGCRIDVRDPRSICLRARILGAIYKLHQPGRSSRLRNETLWSSLLVPFSCDTQEAEPAKKPPQQKKASDGRMTAASAGVGVALAAGGTAAVVASNPDAVAAAAASAGAAASGAGGAIASAAGSVDTAALAAGAAEAGGAAAEAAGAAAGAAGSVGEALAANSDGILEGAKGVADSLADTLGKFM